MASLTTISNISQQTIPILINTITEANAAAASDVPATQSELRLAPRTEASIETIRTNVAQLEQLANRRLITYSHRTS